MGCQLVTLGPEFLSNFQLKYFVCLLLTKTSLSWSPKFAVKSASREEGLGYRKSCLTEAVQLDKRHDLLASVSLNSMISNVPLVLNSVLLDNSCM